jgi:hypothetical protein
MELSPVGLKKKTSQVFLRKSDKKGKGKQGASSEGKKKNSLKFF